MKITVAICFLIIAGFNASAQTRETWTTDDEQSYIVTDKGEKIYGEVTFLFKVMKFKYWGKQNTRDLDMKKYAELLTQATEKYNEAQKEAMKAEMEERNNAPKGDLLPDVETEESRAAGLALQELNELKYVPQIGISFNDERREKTYAPGDIRGFMYKGEVWVTHEVRNGLKKEDLFVKAQYADGPIRLYNSISRSINTDQFPPVTEYGSSLTMQKHDEKDVDPLGWMIVPGRFRKKLSEFVSDYAELSEKIKNGEQGYSMKMTSLIKDGLAGSERSPMERVAEEYNQWYQENK